MCYTGCDMSRSSHELAGQLRAAIDRSGLSGNQLAHIAGVSQSVVSRFLRDERTITLETASKLAAALGLELTPVKRRRKGR